MAYQPTVLVVDDDENILAAFSDFLRSEHCSMLTAESAEEAMKQLSKYRVDLVVTDVRLKQRSGVTFLLQAKTEYPQLPVIVITGYPDIMTEAAAKQYGAEFFFLKPLELSKLRQALRTCLRLP